MAETAALATPGTEIAASRDPFEESRTFRRGRRAALGIDRDEEQGRVVDAQIDVGEAGERAHEEPGREHEHQGESDLDHHQRAAQGARSFTREARALLLDRLRGRHAAGAQGGDHSKEQGGPDGHDQREGEHTIVKGKVEEDEGVPAGDLADQETAAPLGEGQAEEGAGHREEKGLAQELPGQARPRRAQGQASAQFPAAGVGAGHLEAREVRARDEQDQAHHDHEGEQGLRVAAPDPGEAVRRRDQGQRVAEKARPCLRAAGPRASWLRGSGAARRAGPRWRPRPSGRA